MELLTFCAEVTVYDFVTPFLLKIQFRVESSDFHVELV